jgi:hypothetical protein
MLAANMSMPIAEHITLIALGKATTIRTEYFNTASLLSWGLTSQELL